MRWIFVLLLLGVASVTRADAVVALKTIRANTILTEQDVAINPAMQGIGVTEISDVVGLETRVVLYAGRPIRLDYLGPPALVRRNQMVPLVFSQSGLSISTAGRALDRGAAGETIRVMNMSSRSTLFGKILPNGSVDVSNP